MNDRLSDLFSGGTLRSRWTRGDEVDEETVDEPRSVAPASMEQVEGPEVDILKRVESLKGQRPDHLTGDALEAFNMLTEHLVTLLNPEEGEAPDFDECESMIEALDDLLSATLLVRRHPSRR